MKIKEKITVADKIILTILLIILTIGTAMMVILIFGLFHAPL